ncbi:MAG: TonB-dependent receptor [Bacteroidaceae bacterium]|nr:TonB-dependent receptor [Bacteroidaceae bacterium]
MKQQIVYILAWFFTAFMPTAVYAESVDSLIVVSLDEVEIVSSPKETGSMRQQPTSVSIINSRSMAEHHVTSLKNIAPIVPNFHIPDYGSRLTSAVYIRGIGSRINTPAVGLYVDNMPYIDKSAFDFHFYDIERVDVLRGPQGTLYGRNTMGGLIKIYTKSPFSGTGTDVALDFTTRDNRYTASITHYHRISSSFAFSAGGYYQGARGMYTNSTTGQRVDNMKSGGGRLRAILKTDCGTQFDFSLGYDNSDEGAYPYYYNGVVAGNEDYPELIGLISMNRPTGYRRSMLNAGLNIEHEAERWQLNSSTTYQNIGDRMTLDQDFLRPDIYTMQQNQRINTVNEELTLRSRRTSTEKPLWEWVSGVNMMYQWLHTYAPVTFHTDGLRWLERNVNRVMPDVATIDMLNLMGFESMGINFRGNQLHMGNTFDTPTLALAAFHQSTFNVTQHLSLSLGLRLDYEHQSMDYDAPADVDYGFRMPNQSNPRMSVDLNTLESHIGYNGTLHRNYVHLLPRLAVKYDLASDRGNIYLSASEGMRSGGYNLQMFSDLLQGAMRADMMNGVKQGVTDYLTDLAASGTTTMPAFVPGLVAGIMDEKMPQFQVPTTQQVVYKPEYTWSFEAGTHLNLPGHSLTLDAAAFIMLTHNQQIARFADTGLGRMMVNAGRSRSIGAEASLRYAPDLHLAIAANYGYTHSTFTRYDDGTAANYSGNHIPFAPMHTMNLDASYTWQLSRPTWLQAISLGANTQAAGRIYWTEANDHSQPIYATLGARLMLHTPNATITLWGKNLTDNHFDTFYFESANHAFSQHGMPLQLGLDIKLSIR